MFVILAASYQFTAQHLNGMKFFEIQLDEVYLRKPTTGRLLFEQRAVSLPC